MCDDGRAGKGQLWAAPWQETSSLTVALQASAHTWLPVSTAFTCAPLVVFQNLCTQQVLHGHHFWPKTCYSNHAWSHGERVACPLCHRGLHASINCMKWSLPSSLRDLRNNQLSQSHAEPRPGTWLASEPDSHLSCPEPDGKRALCGGRGAAAARQQTYHLKPLPQA